MPGWREVPALLRRCVVAVYAKSTGGGPDGVVRAFKICRDTLAKSGYLTPRGQSQILEEIALTGKGWVRNQEHMRQGVEGERKDRQFELLFKMIEPRLWEYDGPGGKKPPVDPPSPDGEQSKPEIKDDQSPIGDDIFDPLYSRPKG